MVLLLRLLILWYYIIIFNIINFEKLNYSIFNLMKIKSFQVSIECKKFETFLFPIEIYISNS